MIGWASASTLAMTGSSISSGSRPRTRPTLSRTSAAAESGLRSSLKRTVIWLDSCRLIEVMNSTPSMPDERILEHLGDLRLDDGRAGARDRSSAR